MIKSLQRNIQLEKTKYKIPHAVQDIIPIRKVWPDGIFQVGNLYSKSFRFTDINYAIAGKEDKTAMFWDYCDLLNCLDSGFSAKITVNNRRVDRERFEKELLIPLKGDRLDGYREEYNQMLKDKLTASGDSIVQERYLTLSAHKKNIREARAYFTRMAGEVTARLARLGSQGTPLGLNDRMTLLRDFFKAGQSAAVPFEALREAKKGHDCREWLCPQSMEFAADHFRLEDTWGRVLYLQTYASYIEDDLITGLCELDRTMMISIDILPVPTDEAVREMQSKLLGIETNVAGWQRRQNENRNYSAAVPYDMEQQRKETNEMLSDLTTRDQHMMFGLVTVVHLAGSKEQLDSDTETLLTLANQHSCQLSTLRWQQRDGLDTALPYGIRRIDALRTLTTESTAILMPFKAQELSHSGGVYIGQNVVSGSMIRIDRGLLLNGHAFYLGVSGSGKSMGYKQTALHTALASEDDIIFLDPESECGRLTQALGGVVLPISPHSAVHINAMDLDKSYGEGRDPLVEKSEFIMSMFEPLTDTRSLTGRQRSILDRAVRLAYEPYIQNNFLGPAPTLLDLRNALLAQPEPEARELALAAELYTTGSLNVFAHQTNADTDARIVCFDIRELDDQLRPVGMVVTLDAIFNRVLKNWHRGRRTWVFVDEFYLLFRYEYSAVFFYKLFKRLRKYGGFITAATQNVDEVLRSDTACMMLANSELLVMLNQAATDRARLAGLLGIPENQLSYVTNVPAGHGLIRCGGSILPFENSFPRNTSLYSLMSTKPGEQK